MSSSSLISSRILLLGLLVALCVGSLLWRQHLPDARQPSPLALQSPVSTKAPATNAVTAAAGSSDRPPQPASVASQIAPAPAATQVAIAREMDIAVSPYASGLREPGTSKRAWDAGYIESFHQAKTGDPVRFELTGGVMAEGSLKIIEFQDAAVAYVSGELTAPQTGKFFFLTPPVGGKAGKAVGVVEFPASKTAYRIEPTGPDGGPEMWQRRLDEVICMDMPAFDPAKLQAAQEASGATESIAPLRPDLVPDYVPSYNANIVSLQSYPGSPAVLLLDFAGGFTGSWGGVTYARPNVSNDTIKDVWKRVAEDYMPFNINVTTDIKVFQAAPAASRQRCCFTTTPITAAGVAYFGSWNWGNDTVCWSVYCAGKPAAEVGAHEPGHTLGLAHQTQDFPDGTHNEYYAGQGDGWTGWAPIMGVGYYKALSTWAKGEYQYAGQKQDELLTIATANNNVHYRSDDTGDTLATSRYLEIQTDNTVFAEGVIEQTDDTDAFQFTTTGGAVSLTVNPVAIGDWNDLATMATLADATDTVIATNNAQDQVSSTITTTLAAGTYTFRVTGAGKNDPLIDGFSSYASLGYYSISGSVAGARQPTRLSVGERAANNTLVGSVTANNPNASPLVYAITSGNTGATFSVDNTGAVRVANNTLLDYYSLAANTAMYGVQFEVFMNITNVNNPALTETNRRVVIAVQQLYAPVPTTLTATLDSSLRIDLAWVESYGSTRYNLKRSTTRGGPYTTLTSPTTSSYTDGDLTSGVTYYYVVSAVNANGESDNSTEASAVALAVAGGFESPSLGARNFQYSPTGGGGWTFGGTSPSGSGIVANGSGFSNPDAPEGVQAGFIQEYGTLMQTFGGFTPGTLYTITYAAAQRGSQSGESWNVVIDGTVIKSNTPGSTNYTSYGASFTATAALHTLSFVGTDLAGGDNTVFIDNVQISIVTPLIANFGFETPGLGTGSGSYRYNPAGGSWAFSGASPSGSGIVGNGSGFSNPNAPLGTQAAFVQKFGTISQSLSGFTPGKTYTLTYSAAQRAGSNGGESWNVKIDGTVIQSNSPGGTGYAFYSANFVATAATHTLSFVGTDLAGGDNTVFIDNVSLCLLSPLQPAVAAVALTSPANNTVFAAYAPVSLTASVTAYGNIINGVQFYVDNIMIGQIANTPYICAWANASGGSHSMFSRVLFNDGSFADSMPVNIVVAAADPNSTSPALTSNTLPATAADVVGSQVTFTAAFTGVGPITYQWQKIVGGQLTDVAGATTGTVTLSNLQLSDTGSYRLQASNPSGISVSAAIPLTVSSVPAAVANVITTFAAQTGLGSADGNFSPTWSVAPGSLIASKTPSTVGSGDFEQSIAVLTDGAVGRLTYGTGSPSVTQVTCGNANGGQSVTYTLGASANGYTLSTIVVYGGWCDAGRDQQAYTVSYSTVADPTTFISLASVNYNPANPNNVQSATRATLSSSTAGPLASNVAALQFDFTTPTSENGYCGYSEIAVYGTSLEPTVTMNTSPVTATDVVGGQVSFTAAISGTAPLSYQWQKVTNGVASNIAGATNATLTLANLQLSDTASYQLQASNASGVAVSSPSTLTVNSVPAAVNNMVTSMAAQTGLGGYTNFLPSWPFDTSNSLIAGMAPSSSAGNFSLNTIGATVNSLTAGDSLMISPTSGGDGGPNYLSCGNGYGSGSSVVYTLPACASGYGLTHITVYGGWRDAGRDQQAYTVSYSKVATPTTFVSLGTVNYNPTNPAAVQSATRATLTAANGVLATNVAAVKFDFTTPASENGWVGYSEIAVYGTQAPSAPTNLAATAGNTQASLTWTAASGATSYKVKRTTVSGGPYTTVASPTGASYLNTGLTNGTIYYYVVSAVNAGGESANSSQVSATPQVPAPPPPTGLTAVAGNTQAGLTWTAASGATSYNVKRATVSGGPYTTVASPTGTSCLNTGLTNGTIYYYVVSAVNAGGESANSSQVSATPQVPAPPAPAGLAATPGNTQASLTWTAASGATSYNVKRATVSGGPYTTVVSPTGTSCLNTGLTNGTIYYYVVSAVNAGGESANSGQASATPQVPAPPAPTGLAAVAGNTQAGLTWTAASGTTSYNVKRATVSGGPYTTVVSPTGTSCLNTGLTNGTIYYYVVSAVNAGGESANSSQVSATPVLANYEAWLAAYPSISGSERAPDADPDHDGVPNGIEFLTGTSPADPTGSAPVSTTLDSAGNLVLHFKRVVAAKAFTVAVESSASLDGPWTSLIVTNDAVTGPPLTVVENGTAADDITVVIPSDGAPRKFARLRIAIPVTP